MHFVLALPNQSLTSNKQEGVDELGPWNRMVRVGWTSWFPVPLWSKSHITPTTMFISPLSAHPITVRCPGRLPTALCKYTRCGWLLAFPLKYETGIFLWMHDPSGMRYFMLAKCHRMDFIILQDGAGVSRTCWNRSVRLSRKHKIQQRWTLERHRDHVHLSVSCPFSLSSAIKLSIQCISWFPSVTRTWVSLHWHGSKWWLSFFHIEGVKRYPAAKECGSNIGILIT